MASYGFQTKVKEIDIFKNKNHCSDTVKGVTTISGLGTESAL